MNTTTLFKLLLMSFCTSALISCSKENDDLPGTTSEGSMDSYLSPTVPQGKICVESVGSRTIPFLGAGYDIMGSYIDNYSVKEPVIDFSKADIRIRTRASGISNNFKGCNATEFLQFIKASKNFIVPIENKDDLLCTETITELLYSKDPYDCSSQYTFIYNDWGESLLLGELITPKNNDWTSLYTDNFREELELLSPEDIMDTYGTHILVNVQLGRTIKTLYCSVVADNESNILNTATKAMYSRQKRIFKHIYSSDIYYEESVRKNYGGKVVVSLQGADYKLLPFINLTIDNREVLGNPIDLTPWIQSGNDKNCALTTLTGNDLIPIYDVISDPVKKQQIKEAVISHIKAHQLPVLQTAPIFQASDGNHHRYYTSYNELTQKKDICGGVIGSVFLNQEPGTVPLYRYSNGDNHRLSLYAKLQGNGKIIGYVYEKKTDELNCIFEISDGENFAYTTEEKDVYGENGTWKPTGIVFYTKKV